jgi:hypothetical protein
MGPLISNFVWSLPLDQALGQMMHFIFINENLKVIHQINDYKYTIYMIVKVLSM